GLGGRGRPQGHLAARDSRPRLRLERRPPRQRGGVKGDGFHRGPRRGHGPRHDRGDSLMQGKRLDRVNQLIKEEVSMLLQRELKDPRLGFVTVTDVETSKDLRSAKIFVSVLGDERQWTASLTALEHARGFVRNWLRQHLDLRVTPEIDFRADRSMEHAARIQSILKQVQGE